MSENEQLNRIESILESFHTSLTVDGGVLRVGLKDLLDINGQTAMSGEVIGILRNQVQALAEVLYMLLGREIENSKQLVAIVADIAAVRVIVEALAHTRSAGIVQDAEAARLRILAAQAIQLGELATQVLAAQTLLKDARVDERAKIKRAVHEAQVEIAAAASDAREVIAQAQTAEET